MRKHPCGTRARSPRKTRAACFGKSHMPATPRHGPPNQSNFPGAFWVGSPLIPERGISHVLEFLLNRCGENVDFTYGAVDVRSDPKAIVFFVRHARRDDVVLREQRIVDFPRIGALEGEESDPSGHRWIGAVKNPDLRILG